MSKVRKQCPVFVTANDFHKITDQIWIENTETTKTKNKKTNKLTKNERKTSNRSGDVI